MPRAAIRRSWEAMMSLKPKASSNPKPSMAPARLLPATGGRPASPSSSSPATGGRPGTGDIPAITHAHPAPRSSKKRRTTSTSDVEAAVFSVLNDFTSVIKAAVAGVSRFDPTIPESESDLDLGEARSADYRHYRSDRLVPTPPACLPPATARRTVLRASVGLHGLDESDDATERVDDNSVIGQPQAAVKEAPSRSVQAGCGQPQAADKEASESETLCSSISSSDTEDGTRWKTGDVWRRPESSARRKRRNSPDSQRRMPGQPQAASSSRCEQGDQGEQGEQGMPASHHDYYDYYDYDHRQRRLWRNINEHWVNELGERVDCRGRPTRPRGAQGHGSKERWSYGNAPQRARLKPTPPKTDPPRHEGGAPMPATGGNDPQVYVFSCSSTSDNENEKCQPGSHIGLLSEPPFVGRFNDNEDHRRAAAAEQRSANDPHRLWLDYKRRKRTLKRNAEQRC